VISVETTLKGPAAKEWALAATPTWTCDISGTRVGERGLFFLEPYRATPGSSQYTPGPHLLEQVAARGLGPLHSLTYHGRGRMPVHLMDGKERLAVWKWDVLLPPEIEAASVETADPRASRWEKSVPLEAMLDWVERYVAEEPGALTSPPPSQ